jgi:hypothetical protein
LTINQAKGAHMAAPRKKIVPAAPTGIYGDILKITGMKREDGETLVKYVERVGTHMGAMPDESFALFSPETADWFDKTVEAVNAKKPDNIPPVTGWPEDKLAAPAVDEKKVETKSATPAAKAAAPAPAATANKEPEVADKKPSKKPILKKKAAATPAKKPVKAAAKKANGAAKPKQRALPGTGEGGKARVDGIAYKIRLAVIKKPDISFEAAAEKAGCPKAEVGGHAHNMWNHARIICQMQKAIAG